MRYVFLRYLILLGAALAVFYASVGHGRELYPGQYAQMDPQVRQWFRSQESPATGGNCCSEADGTYAEEDIRYDEETGVGHYWTRFVVFPGDKLYERTIDWMEVPDDVVIRDPNKNGSPVVWFYFENGDAKIRCYSPGGGV